ncbi:MAG TPA: hypothetical protein VJ617_09630 [Arthrobacter sp.]|nr:hypothetical protein [Arthrobacter sp.]
MIIQAGFDLQILARPLIVQEGNYSESPILQEAKRLKAAAAQRGLRMIGHFGLDETGYMSDGPHSYFDQYGLSEGLPPTMSYWVNSKYGKCG